MSLLPIELLIQVVYWSLPRDDEFYWFLHDNPVEYFSTLNRNSEKLWAIVDPRFPDAVWTAALTRSQVQPLAVLLSSGADLVRYSDFVIRIFSHIHRWSAAELTLQRPEDVTLFNTVEASTLLRLRISFDGPNKEARPQLHISQHTTPRLRHLSLLYLGLDPSQLSQLTSLTLINVQLPSVDQVLTALRNNPGLHVLRLTECDFVNEAIPKPEATPPIRLERLRLDGFHLRAPAILDALYTPNCSNYSFLHDIERPGAEELVQSFISGKERATLLHNYLSKHRHLEIHIEEEDNWEITVGAEHGDRAPPPEYYCDCWSLEGNGISVRRILLE
ncbi:hypothetical protein FRB93_006867 [Tulasnella sp. JGI-2019a]|nr:hypothetical protein FRB93_006867 [Tulasnella sp. JGI-2019a]